VFPPVAEPNTHLLEVLVSQMGEYRGVNFIFGKTPRVSPKTQLPKPICNVLHGASWLIGLSGGMGGVPANLPSRAGSLPCRSGSYFTPVHALGPYFGGCKSP